MQQLQKEDKLADRRSTLHANLLFFRVWLRKMQVFKVEIKLCNSLQLGLRRTHIIYVCKYVADKDHNILSR